MLQARWRQIEDIYDAVVRLDPGVRAAYLEQACEGDHALRQELESLLAFDPAAETFLESPAEEMAVSEVGEPDERPHLVGGQQLGPYRVLALLGVGGMGVVYKAIDTRLQREVALKILPQHSASDVEHFQREARAASALNHPNICTIHDVGEFDGQLFLVMELLEGESLKERLGRWSISVTELLAVGIAVAKALEAAHSKNIVHRDIKPANIFLSVQGGPKILDFGLAKLLSEPARPDAADLLFEASSNPFTRRAMGTAAYVSPEQARGERVDERTDLFSLGVTLYQMATGTLPFSGATPELRLRALLSKEPRHPSELNRALPKALNRIILKALEKDRAARYQSASELRADLEGLQAGLKRQEFVRRPKVAIPALMLAAVMIASVAWVTSEGRQQRWARTVALPEIGRLVAKEDFDSAFRLARQAERYLAGDPEFENLRRHFEIQQSVNTDPPGAEVYVKGYMSVDKDWIYVGRSPIEEARFPNRYTRWKVMKKGFETAEGSWIAYTGFRHPSFRLQAVGAAPPGMVLIPGGAAQVRGLPPVELEDYWLDKFEVSNREYKQFVDSGGYGERSYWKNAFMRGGEVLSWEQAMDQFRDSTGRPGPSTWKFGTFPAGQEDYPVSGVSWYEAAAFAEFAGKQLPTVYHWYKNVGNPVYSDIVRLSNFSGKGPAAVASHAGISQFGNYGMAGNVREWCWNQAGRLSSGPRYILGGSWGDQSYVFTVHNDAALPFDRSAVNGFRCARYTSRQDDAVLKPLEALSRDYSKEKPVSDAVFQIYQKFFSYDHSALNARLRSVDDTQTYWRRETVTFDAAYGNERMTAHLFLPRNTAPPYQAVIYFPCAAALVAKSSEELELMVVEFLVRSGRAVLYPVYKGMYERHSEISVAGPASLRDRTIFWSKDFSRSVDYLETRTDIDRERLAYYGLSLGAIWGPVLTAIDGRMKASVYHGGGLPQYTVPAEVDPLNFASRVKEPVLLIGGRLDFIQPVETCQMPLFRLLGSPAMDKKMAIFDRGHSVYPISSVFEESLAWLDRYLRPVATK